MAARVYYCVGDVKSGKVVEFSDVNEAAIAFARIPADCQPHAHRIAVDSRGHESGALVASVSSVTPPGGAPEYGKWAGSSDPAFKSAYGAAIGIPSRKQPWEMTKTEWHAAYGDTRSDTVQSRWTKGSASEATRKAGDAEFLRFGVCAAAQEKFKRAANGEIRLSPEELSEIEDRLQTPVHHEDVVAHALSLELPVPARVLEDYPELNVQRKSAPRM